MVSILVAFGFAVFLVVMRFIDIKQRAVSPGERFFTKEYRVMFLGCAILLLALFVADGIWGAYSIFSLASIYWSVGGMIILILSWVICVLVMKPRPDRY